MNVMHPIAMVADCRPPTTQKIRTSLGLSPEMHLAVGHLALELGIPREEVFRRALVLAGVVPADPQHQEEADHDATHR